jgi:ketosteroid isomerase-like protein
MRYIKLFSYSTFVFVLVISLGSISSIKAQMNSEQSAVEAANRAFYKAFGDESMKEMNMVWSHSEYVRAIHPNSKDILNGWKAVGGSWEAVFKHYKDIKITASNMVVHIEGNVAWVSDYEHFQAMDGKKPVTLEATATNMFVKKDGKWWMVFHQATVPVKMG